MPYIITTTSAPRPRVEDARESRRAVATLDEARKTALHALDGQHANEIGSAWFAAGTLPESGGTVGPLPDGTVIEVERSDEPVRSVRVLVLNPVRWEADEIAADLEAIGFRQVTKVYADAAPSWVEPDYVACCFSDPDRITDEAIAAYNEAQS